MSLFSFLSKNKIIPSRVDILKKDAQRTARNVTKQFFAGSQLNNKEVGEFTNNFVDEIKKILIQRKDFLESELKNTIDSINKI